MGCATYFRDSETGIDYADQRYHQPGGGRFFTPDPAASGLNWYAYVGGDPVNGSDPSGLAMLEGCSAEADCFGGSAGPTFSITVYSCCLFTLPGWAYNNLNWNPFSIPVGPGAGLSGGGGGVGGTGTSASGVASNNPRQLATGLTPNPISLAMTPITADPVINGGKGNAAVPTGAPDASSNIPPELKPICLNPGGCGAMAPTITDNWAFAFSASTQITNTLREAPVFMGGEGTFSIVPGTGAVYLGGTASNLGFTAGDGFSLSLLFTPNGAPIAPIIAGPSFNFTLITPWSIGGTYSQNSSGVYFGPSFGSPTLSFSYTTTGCIFNCHP